MSHSAPDATESAVGVGRKAALKPLSPQLDLEENSPMQHITSHNLKSIDILPQLRRKLPAKGIVLVFLGLALYILLMYLPAFSVVIYPCGNSTSCSVIKSQIFTKTNNFSVESTISKSARESEHLERADIPTDLRHIVFCIASTANNWNSRHEYVKLWWQPPEGGTPRRGYVWLDEQLPASTANFLTNDTMLPDMQISGNADNFSYTWEGGSPSAIRVSRMVSETFRLGLEDVRWFVMGDDDTIFFPENLAAVLRQYDHKRFYYIGQSSESQTQSVIHSFGMAYGGGGIAISYALTEAMEKMQDDCLSRYPHVYGSDSRIEACIAELGVPLTTAKGFHQVDIRGDISGFLAAHPVAPLVSLHHIDNIEPIFPDKSRLEGLRHLVEGALRDPAGALQQSICYDISRNITLSVSWGYVVQIFSGILTAMEVQKPSLSFIEWKTSQTDPEVFKFDVRRLPADACKRPVLFFMENVTGTGDGKTFLGVYRRKRWLEPENCHRFIGHDVVEVYKQRQSDSWITAPQRQYCEVVAQKYFFIKPDSLTLQVRDFKQNEIIAPHK